MKVTVKKISELKRPERNVRMHTDKQLVEFRRSVEMFGQIRPIVIDENNVILAGNGLYETLLSLGHTEADCYVVKGLTEKEKKKLMLADNRIFDLGVDDMKGFDEFIAELGDDLDVPGFDDELLRSLNAAVTDVDDILSDYGKITDEKKEQIASAAETYRKEEEARAADLDEDEEDDSEAEVQSAGRYVICPKCGEKIWL